MESRLWGGVHANTMAFDTFNWADNNEASIG